MNNSLDLASIYKQVGDLMHQIKRPNGSDKTIMTLIKEKETRIKYYEKWNLPAEDPRLFKVFIEKYPKPVGTVYVYNLEGHLGYTVDKNYCLEFYFERRESKRPMIKTREHTFLDLDDKHYREFLRDIARTMTPTFAFNDEFENVTIQYHINEPSEIIPIMDMLEGMLIKHLGLFFLSLPQREARFRKRDVERTLQKIGKIQYLDRTPWKKL